MDSKAAVDAEAPAAIGDETAAAPAVPGFSSGVRLQARWARLRERPPVADLALLAVLLAVVAFLWGRAAGTWLWLDEGIAIGISSHPLTEIPGLLRQDGSPPLYYFLLHMWMSLFGSSEIATHLLSLVFGLAVVVSALWAGWSLFGRRTGWILALLASLSPFLAYYVNETRMYSLVALLGLLATATFLHAFVFGRRRYLPAFSVCLVLLLYTHNWGLFLGIGAALALVPCLAISLDRRRLVVDAALAFGAVALLYAPWVPSLLYQRSHTFAMWVQRPTLLQTREDLIGLLGPREAFVAIGLGVGGAFFVLLRPPWNRTTIAMLATIGVVVSTLAVAWAISRGRSVWTYRYLAVVVGPLLIVLAAGLARGGRVALVGLAVYAFLLLPVGVKTPPFAKSNVQLITAAASPHLQPGDLVITDFGRTPLLHYYLPPGLRYAEANGLVADPSVSDQRDGTERLEQGDPRRTLSPLLDSLPVGGHVLVVCPPPTAEVPADTEFVVLAQQRCDQAKSLVLDDPRFRLDLTELAQSPLPYSPANGYLATKIAA